MFLNRILSFFLDSKTKSSSQSHPAFSCLEKLKAYRVSQCISVFAQLGIADHIKENPLSAQDLSDLLKVNPEFLDRVLKALVSVAFLKQDHFGKYSHTEESRCLCVDHPNSVKNYASLIGQPWYWDVWSGLVPSIKSGQTGFHQKFGKHLFEFLEDHQTHQSLYNKAMNSMTSAAAKELNRVLDFSQIKTVLDIGGGIGGVLKELLQMIPHLEGKLLERASVINEAKANIPSSLHSRVQFYEGDFFKNIPSGNDLYFMRHVLHDWNDEDAHRILLNCRKAMKAGSKLMIMERVLDGNGTGGSDPFTDIEMMMFTNGGKERTSEEFRKLLTPAGFKVKQIHSTSIQRAILEVEPS